MAWKLINNKGFTLIELLVTVAIMGILSALSVANFTEYKRNVNDVVAQSHIVNLRTAFEARLVDRSPDEDPGFDTIEYDGSSWTVSGSSEPVSALLPGYVSQPEVALAVSSNLLALSYTILTSHCFGTLDYNYGIQTVGWKYESLIGISHKHDHWNGGSGSSTDLPFSGDGSDCP